MRIGLDFDGVLVDHGEHKLRLAAARGFNLERWQANTNLMQEFLPEEDYREIKEVIYTLLTPHAPPVKGMLEHLDALEGELYLISARRTDSIRFAQDWMQHHRIYDRIPAERVYFCSNSSEKYKYIQRLGIEAYLDDKVSVLESLPYQTRKFLLDPDGVAERYELRSDIEVVPHWRDFVRMLQEKKEKA